MIILTVKMVKQLDKEIKRISKQSNLNLSKDKEDNNQEKDKQLHTLQLVEMNMRLIDNNNLNNSKDKKGKTATRVRTNLLWLIQEAAEGL